MHAILLAVLLSQQSADETRVVSGTVTNEAGEPIAGAELFLPVRFRGPYFVEGKTDATGRFRMEVPTKWFLTPRHRNFHTIWVLHSDYAVGIGSAWKCLFKEQKPDDAMPTVEIRLRKSQTLKVIVKDPKGKPVPDIQLEPFYSRGASATEWIPEKFRKRMRVKANAKGMLILPRVRHEDIVSVHAISKEFGIQEFRIPKEGRNRKIDMQLAPVGKIQGEVSAENPEWLEGIIVHITSRPEVYPTEGQSPGRGISGVIEIGEDGKFTVPAIAAGPLMIDVSSDPKHPARLKLPGRNKKLHPEKTMLLKIPLLPATPIRGRVEDVDGNPVPDASVSVAFGEQRQSDSCVTDKDGVFSGFVLPGKSYSHVISVKSFGPWEQKGQFSDRYKVPDQREVFDVPVVTLLRTRAVAGRLLDSNDSPLPNYSITATLGLKVADRCKTDDKGNFKIQLPAEERPDSFRVRPTDGCAKSVNATVVEWKPQLVLKVNKD